MGRFVLTYGLIAGAIVGVPLFAMMVLMGGDQLIENGALIGYTIMLVAFSMIFLAIKRRRDIGGGGVIRFWPAVGLGIGISLVAGLCFVIAWEAALAVTKVDFMAMYRDAMIADEQAKGASPAALAKLRADMDAFAASYADPLFRIPMTLVEILPVGILVSLVSAGLLRNPRFLPARRGTPGFPAQAETR